MAARWPLAETHWICIHLPELAVESLRRSGASESGLAVIESQGSRRLIHACDETAAALGLRPGMALSAAYALHPGLIAHGRNLHAEQQGLERVALAAWQLSDRVSIMPPDSVVAEVGRSRYLLRQRRIRSFFKHLDYSLNYAAAPNPWAARLLAHAGLHRSVSSNEALAAIELSHGDFDEACRQGLKGVGVRTYGELFALPRDGLARRFGSGLLEDLDRLTGRRADPLPWFKPPDVFNAQLELLQESEDAQALVFAGSRLLRELADFLRIRERAVQRFQLLLHHAHGRHTEVAVGLLEPDRHAGRLSDLLRERMHHIQLSASVIRLTLHADELIEPDTGSGDLFDTTTPEDRHGWARVVERLRSRLGERSVQSLELAADHRPERAWRISEDEPRRSSLAQLRNLPPRPLWLLHPPRPLRADELQLESGPERIESGWWDQADAARDYYIARNRAGQKLWVFRDCRGARSWFLHGYFG